MGAGVVFLTLAAVLYQKDPTFINWIDNKPFFNVNFGLFAAGMTLIVIGLIVRSLQNNPNINKYKGLTCEPIDNIKASVNSSSPVALNKLSDSSLSTDEQNTYV